MKNQLSKVIITTFLIGLLLGLIFMNVKEYENLRFIAGINNTVFFFEIFWKIISTNFLVAFLLSIVGFFSGGTITLIIIFVNSINLSYYIKAVYYIDTSIWIKLKLFIFHSPMELISFFIFSKIGMKGLLIIKHLYVNGTISLDKILKENLSKKEFYLPSLLLFISAIVESLIMIQL